MGRLLCLFDADVQQFHDDVRAGLRHRLPGAVRASANRATTVADIARLGDALREIAATPERAADYTIDAHGDFAPRSQPARVPVTH